MKAVFKPQSEAHVEKMHVMDGEPVPEGWYANKEAALAAWVPPKKRGPKPKKSEEADASDGTVDGDGE
jgi:hypothetical protein